VNAHGAPEVDAETVRGLAGRLGRPADGSSLRWHVEPLSSPLHPESRVHRLRVAGGSSGPAEAWSAVLKVVPADGTVEQRREVAIYRSGLLGALPEGLRAPGCLWIQERADGATWLWLEDVRGAQEGWSVARLGLAARHLGRWNGLYLVGAPLPALPALSRDWLAAWIEANAPAIARLRQVQDLPAVCAAWPPAVCRRILALWERRAVLLAGLQGLPATFCHHDAHPGNMIPVLRAGRQETVLLDWQFAGHGVVGTDAAPLLGASLTEGALAPSVAAALDREVFGGYVAGLREAGWAGDERLARAGFAGVAGLRYTVGTTRFLLPLLEDPAAGARVEARLGLASGALPGAFAALFPFFLALADEAESLLCSGS